MRRRLLSRKWLALHVLLVVCLVSFSLLGRWQLTRAESVDGTIRNMAYALQWWIFAAFAIFFWWKMLKSDLAEDRGETAAPSQPAPAGSREATRSAGGDASYGLNAGLDSGAAARDAAGSGRGADVYPRASDQILDANDPEDAELIAYNRYLEQLNERQERARSR